MKKQRMKVKKIFSYTVVLEPAEEDGYIVSVPALPGCVTQGGSFEEAMEMAKDAIELYLASQRDLGQEIFVEPEKTIIVRMPAELTV